MSIGLVAVGSFNRAALVVEEGPVATLVRDINGLVFKDNFNRADEQLDVSSFWLRTDGTGKDNIVSNKVVPASPYGDAQTTGIPSVPSSSMYQINFIQASGGSGFGSYWTRNALSGNQNREGVGVEWNTGLNTYIMFIEENNTRHGSHTIGDLGLVNQTARIVISDIGPSGIKARFYRKQIGSLSDVTSSLAQVGIELSASAAQTPALSDIFRATHGAAANHWDEVMIMGGFTIRIDGLPTGYKARVIGADTTGSLATESGGTATINVELTSFPAEGVEVTDGSDVVQVSFFSGSGIWGGDIYTFSE